MMNDRFSAQLRGHLLRTADTRPADGQLAAIDELVAVTAQRHPLVTRLPWFHGRINPFPSVAVRYGLIAIALIIAIVAAALAAGVGLTRRTVFEGTWTSTDVPDGSRQTLVVGPGMSPAVHFVDDWATGGSCVDDEVKVFTMDGIGTIVDERLFVEWPDGGGCGLMTVFVGPGTYTYDEASDIITDGDDITWTRVSTSVVPDGTPAPPSSPSPHPATGNPDCIDYREGGTYAQSVDPLTVTATLPAGTENGWWSGSPDVFAAGSDTCLFSPAIELEVSLPWQLFGDACTWRDTAADVRSRAGALATLSQNGLESTPATDATLGGYPASRFEISVPKGFDLTRCDDGQLRLWDSGPGRDSYIDPDHTVRVYLVDIDGLILGVTATYSPADERVQAHMAELDAILASLRIEPQ